MIKVNEIFYSIQGEGEKAGTPTVFIRLAGCNLNCPFCDTNFIEYTETTEEDILYMVQKYPSETICFTGGEPLLQDLRKCLYLLEDYDLHLETNGTILIPEEFEFTTLSPKAFNVLEVNLHITDSIKFLCGIPQWEEIIEKYLPLVSGTAYLQPLSLDEELTKKAYEYVMQHPRLKLSLQLHKYINVK